MQCQADCGLRQWDQLCPDEAGGFTGTHRATSPWLIVYRSAAVLHAWVCAEADRSMMLQKSIMHVLTQWWMIIANKQKNVKCMCFFEFSTIIPMFFYVISLSHPMPSACPPGPTTISPPLHPRKCETTCTCDHRIYLSRWFLSIQPLIHPTYPMYPHPSMIRDRSWSSRHVREVASSSFACRRASTKCFLFLLIACGT